MEEAGERQAAVLYLFPPKPGSTRAQSARQAGRGGGRGEAADWTEQGPKKGRGEKAGNMVDIKVMSYMFISPRPLQDKDHSVVVKNIISNGRK